MRRRVSSRIGIFVLALSSWACIPAIASAQRLADPPRDVRFDQKLGEEIDLDLVFTDAAGEEHPLGDYFHESRPVILALVYYECPMLCNMVLNGLISSLRPLDFDPGSDFEVVVLSFDPGEKAPLARAKRDNYLQAYDRAGTEAGWHFLTGDEASIAALTDAVGFRYVYDEELDQYAHASGVTVLTPTGKLSSYLFGIEYSPKDLRLSLVEASQNKIGTVVDQLLLLCFAYDPSTGRYGATVMFFVRLGGILTVLAFLGFVIVSRRREQRAQRLSPGGVA